MDVERIPKGGVNDVPDIAQESSLLIDSGRRHHETNTVIRHEHENGSNDVQHDRHAQMDPLEESLLHLVPTVIVDVEGAALGDEHQCIDMHHGSEDAGKIPEKCRIE